MKLLRRLGLPGLLLAVALLLAACGGNAGGSGGDRGDGMQGMDHGGGGQAEQDGAKKADGGMAGMDHEGMDHEGMDHGGTGSGGMAAMSRRMVTPGGEYSDAAFVDAMVPHHEGAVEMARVGLENAEHGEIRRLSRDIIDSQRAEIEELGRIREGLDAPATEMSGGDMSTMGMMEDPRELAKKDPFDRAFIDNMIPHHESATAMAGVALEESGNPEVRKIAGDIVSAQEREIRQMRQWREEWYPRG